MTAFVLGIVIGVFIGMFVMGLCICARGEGMPGVEDISELP